MPANDLPDVVRLRARQRRREVLGRVLEVVGVSLATLVLVKYLMMFSG
jgi:hypothetical protein